MMIFSIILAVTLVFVLTKTYKVNKIILLISSLASLILLYPGYIAEYFSFTISMMFIIILITIALVDTEKKEIPGVLMLIELILALAKVIYEKYQWMEIIQGFIPSLILFVLAAVLFFITKEEVLGMGDVKLYVAIGLFIGHSAVYALFATFIVAFFQSLIYIIRNKGKVKTASIAFAPSIAIASILFIILKL